jgi:hypothetical protein
MLEIITLLIVGLACVFLIAICIAIDKAGDMQDDEKH